MDSVMDNNNGTALSYLDMLSGGAFSNATLFAMGVSPYIDSSIIMQLLTVAIRPLERMAKEGEEGRKKIATITRYVTVILGLIQGTAYYFYLRNSSVDGQNIVLYRDGGSGVFVAFIIILAFTAGTAMMMWMGEQINQKGIGNGISILLFAGIVASMPLYLRLADPEFSICNCRPATQRTVLMYLFRCLWFFSWRLSGLSFYAGFRAPDPGSVCKACCGPEDVWRPEQSYSD